MILGACESMGLAGRSLPHHDDCSCSSLWWLVLKSTSVWARMPDISASGRADARYQQTGARSGKLV